MNRIIIIISALLLCACDKAVVKSDVMDSDFENLKVRLAYVTVDSLQLEQYNAFLSEEIEASMRLEEGVVMLYAVSDKNNLAKVTILEIYKDEESYERHIKTPHFIKYKEETLDMVEELELVEVKALKPELIRKICETKDET